ncbi:glycosyl transferase family 90 [Celeribacter sp.]|uniref:glycosyl transferase family 90 n=1 Tax=Celeribacter sp. TaxID=1890673 RepID=UPI003A8FAB00
MYALRNTHYIRKYFAGNDLAPPRMRQVYSDEVASRTEMHLVREGGGITVMLSPRALHGVQRSYKHIPPAYIHWFAQSDAQVKRITCDLTDGESPGLSRFTYSTCFKGKVLLPDQHFFRSKGYAGARRIAADAPDWEARDEGLFWRGQTTGVGLFSVDPDDLAKPWVLQRLRTALVARDLPDSDVRFVEGSCTLHPQLLDAAGLLGERRELALWAGDKYALDVDGFTNAWCNLFERLLLGCCVLKVDSQYGFRQWYYDRLVPFETHVPIRADLSDFAEKLDWVRSHPMEARRIAKQGQALALSLTFESETKFAAQQIEAHWED